MPVLIAEQHVQDWTSAQIAAALKRRGYKMRDWHPTQDLEKFVPADWLFFDQTRLKVFGIQYKALYVNGDEHWRLDRTQHATLVDHPWIVYCASEVTDVAQECESLDRARFYSSDIPYRATIRRRTRKPAYYRWPDFIRGFEACLIGRKIKSRAELVLLMDDAEGLGPRREAAQAAEYLFLNLDRKRALRVRTVAGRVAVQ